MTTPFGRAPKGGCSRAGAGARRAAAAGAATAVVRRRKRLIHVRGDRWCCGQRLLSQPAGRAVGHQADGPCRAAPWNNTARAPAHARTLDAAWRRCTQGLASALHTPAFATLQTSALHTAFAAFQAHLYKRPSSGFMRGGIARCSGKCKQYSTARHAQKTPVACTAPIKATPLLGTCLAYAADQAAQRTPHARASEARRRNVDRRFGRHRPNIRQPMRMLNRSIPQVAAHAASCRNDGSSPQTDKPSATSAPSFQHLEATNATPCRHPHTVSTTFRLMLLCQ